MRAAVFGAMLPLLFAAATQAQEPVPGADRPQITNRIGNQIEDIFRSVLAQARERSFDLKIARANVRRAGAAKYTSLTRLFPHVDLQLSQSRAEDFTILQSGALGTQAGFFQPLPQNLARWNLALSFPIYQRAAWLGFDQATDESRLNDLQLRSKESELDWRLRSSFSQYLLDSYRCATLGNSIQAAEMSSREANLRFELGSRTKIDVLRAKSNLATLESKQISDEQSRATSLHHFLQDAGIDQNGLKSAGFSSSMLSEESLEHSIEEFSSVDKFFSRLRPFLADPAEGNGSSPIEKRILETSPVYESSAAQEALSISRAKSSLDQEWPSLEVQGNLTKQGPSWKEAFLPGDHSYSIGVVLNVPLFSGGRVFSAAIESSAAQEAARAQGSHDAVQLRNDLEDQRMRINALQKLIISLKLTVDQNQQVRELSFKSYQLGKSTMVELLDSQNALIESKINLAQSKTDLAVSTRQLAWNLGVPLP